MLSTASASFLLKLLELVLISTGRLLILLHGGKHVPAGKEVTFSLLLFLFKFKIALLVVLNLNVPDLDYLLKFLNLLLLCCQTTFI